MSIRCNTDLKLKNMDLVESYYSYHRILQKMSENKCHGCIKLKEHITLMKEQNMYKDQLNELKFQMSDEALQQMPEFQGRVRLNIYLFFLGVLTCTSEERLQGIRAIIWCMENKLLTVISLIT
jgi:hypothetical protein